MTRISLVLAVSLGFAALGPGRAAAQTTTTRVPIPATAVQIQVGTRTPDGNDINLISTTDQPKMFNIANCECGTPRTAKVTIGGAAAQNGMTNVYFYLGSNCDDITYRPQCRQIAVHRLSEFFNTAVLQDVTGDEVVSPAKPTCTPSSGSGSSSFYVMIDWKGDQSFASSSATIQSLSLNYNVQRPGLVTDLTASPGENAINLSWTVPSDTDLLYIQVLCARGELPVFKSGTFGPAFESSDSVCPPSGDGGVGDGGQEDAGPQDAGQQDAAYYPPTQQDGGTSSTTDGGVVTGTTAIAGFANLDPAYLCSNGLGPTASAVRIDGLQNGVTYYFAVVAVNTSGNPSPIETMVAGTPQEMLDFWEDYKRQGGQATGCAVEPVRVGWAGAGLAVLGLGLVLYAVRRRRGGGK
jgi:hypothetical protein